jgi:hypothetical protein
MNKRRPQKILAPNSWQNHHFRLHNLKLLTPTKSQPIHKVKSQELYSQSAPSSRDKGEGSGTDIFVRIKDSESSRRIVSGDDLVVFHSVRLVFFRVLPFISAVFSPFLISPCVLGK